MFFMEPPVVGWMFSIKKRASAWVDVLKLSDR
jgi:hypothetical protein